MESPKAQAQTAGITHPSNLGSLTPGTWRLPSRTSVEYPLDTARRHRGRNASEVGVRAGSLSIGSKRDVGIPVVHLVQQVEERPAKLELGLLRKTEAPENGEIDHPQPRTTRIRKNPPHVANREIRGVAEHKRGRHALLFQILIAAEVRDSQPSGVSYVTHHDLDIAEPGT